MRMKKKGFTLIELLAVIVILAIITVIAVPKILDVIEKSKQSSAEISAKMYIDTINKSNMLSETSDSYKKYGDGDDIDVSEITELHMKGDFPTSGTVSIKNSKVIKANLCISGYEIEYENGSSVVIAECSDEVIEVISKKIYNSIQLNDGVDVTYKSNNSDIVEVTENGMVSSKKSGKAIIFVIKDNKKIKKYNIIVDKETIPIEFTEGSFKSVSSDITATSTRDELNEVYKLMKDGSYTEKNGKYGSMMLGLKGKAYLKFAVNSYVTVLFSSANYSDTGGKMGKEAIFYKIDSDGSEVEYSRFTTISNGKNYASISFEPGNYVLRNSANYVEFEEWEFN